MCCQYWWPDRWCSPSSLSKDHQFHGILEHRSPSCMPQRPVPSQHPPADTRHRCKGSSPHPHTSKYPITQIIISPDTCPAPQDNVPLPHQLITFPDIADTMYSFPDCNLMLYRIPFPGHVLQLLTQHHFISTTCGCGVGRGTLRCGGDSACRAGDRGPTGQ